MSDIFLENPLFFLLDITDGLYEVMNANLRGLRENDRSFLESLGQFYAKHSRFTPNQERTLRGVLRRYAWQTRHMPDGFDAEDDSETYRTYRSAHEKDVAGKRNVPTPCLITDD
jgi:hypothetical protein